MLCNFDAAINHPALQFLHGHLLAYLLASLQIDAVFFERIDILIEGEVIVACHIAEHAIDRVIVVADADAVSELHLNILNDERLHYVGFELL